MIDLQIYSVMCPTIRHFSKINGEDLHSNVHRNQRKTLPHLTPQFVRENDE